MCVTDLAIYAWIFRRFDRGNNPALSSRLFRVVNPAIRRMDKKEE